MGMCVTMNRTLRAFVAATGLLALGCTLADAGTGYQGPALQVTVANSVGNQLFDLQLTTTANPNSALITGAQPPLDTDGSKHGSYDAIVWASNPYSGTLDLIAADVQKAQIVRYSGPRYGSGKVLFNWATGGLGSGPANPVALAIDPAGNLFVISPSSKRDATPSLWVLPYVAGNGSYGAPILVDNTFSNVKTIALADVIVANATATLAPGAANPAWSAGDLIVLVGDSFNARVIVYSSTAISGVLATGTPLTGPSSTPVTMSQFQATGALPFGMDLWPADATHGPDLLFSTAEGRLLRFDPGSGGFIADFANGLGANIQRIKVGSYLNVPYVFVAQLLSASDGEILQYGTPPASGTNTAPLAKVTGSLSQPYGLATTTSGSAPASQCVAPSSCNPVGSQLTVQIAAPPGITLPPALQTAQVLDTICNVQNDPRVTISAGNWSCNGQTLDIANYCPGFPSTVLPGFLCGHSGASGTAFSVIKETAVVVDQNANDLLFSSGLDETVPLPGPYDLTCPTSPALFPYVPMIAWAPRSDLPDVEGTIYEWSGDTPFFRENTGYCDKSGSNTKGLSMLAYGLALNAATSGLPNGLPGFVAGKFNVLQNTLLGASIDAAVSAQLQGYIQQAQTYFNSELGQDVADGYACAANTLASADAYARSNAASFHYAAPPAGNFNPLGEIDGLLANLYLTIDAYFLNNVPNTSWPANDIPPCVTLTASPTSVQAAPSATPPLAQSASKLTWGLASPTYPLIDKATTCTVSGSQGTLLTTPYTGHASGTVSTGNLTIAGTYTASLACTAAGSTGTGRASATVTVRAIPQHITFGTAPALATGSTGTFTATASSGLPISTFSASPATVCTITATTANSATVMVLASGTCHVTATQAGNASYAAASATQSATAAGKESQTIFFPDLPPVTAGTTRSIGATASSGLPVAYVASPPETCTVSGSTLTGVAVGPCTITASQNGNKTYAAAPSVQRVVSIVAPALNSLTFNLSGTQVIEVQQVEQLTATALYNNETTANESSNASWSSVNTGASASLTSPVTSVSPLGLVTGQAAGTSTVSATYQSFSATANFIVTDYAVTPNPASASTTAGGVVTYELALAALNGFTDTVSGSGCNLAGLGNSSVSISSPVALSLASPTGTISVTLTTDPALSAGSYSFACTLSSSLGDVQPVSLVVTTAPAGQAAITSFSANGLTPTSSANAWTNTYAIQNNAGGNPLTLSWTTTSAASCTLLSPPAATDIASSPTPVAVPVASAGAPVSAPTNSGSALLATYTLSCQGAGGTTPATAVLSVVVKGASAPFPTLAQPAGLAISPVSGNLYVASAGNGEVLVFAPGTFGSIDTYGRYGLSPGATLTGALQNPTALAFDSAGDLWVTDGASDNVLVFNAAGQQVANATIPFNYGFESSMSPVGVAVDGNGNVYVADSANAVVAVFNYPNGLTGAPALVRYWGRNAVGYFTPTAVSYNPTLDTIAVAWQAFGQTSAVVTEYQASSACCLTSTSEPPLIGLVDDSTSPGAPGANGPNGPTGIAFDANNLAYVANGASNDAVVYNAASDSIAGAGVVGTPTVYTPGPALSSPQGIAVDSTGSIYVANTPGNTVNVYNAAGIFQYTIGNMMAIGQPQYDSNYNALASAYIDWNSPGVPAGATCNLASSDGVYAGTPVPSSSTFGQVVTPAVGALAGGTPVTYAVSCTLPGKTAPYATAYVQVPSVTITPSYLFVNGATVTPTTAFTRAPKGAGYQFNWSAAGIPSSGSCTFTSPNLTQTLGADGVSLSYYLPNTAGPYTASISCSYSPASGVTVTTNVATWTLNLY